MCRWTVDHVEGGIRMYLDVVVSPVESLLYSVSDWIGYFALGLVLIVAACIAFIVINKRKKG